MGLFDGFQDLLLGKDYGSGQLADIQKLFAQLQPQIAGQFGLAQSYGHKALDSIQSNYAAAGRDVARQGQLAQRSIMDRETQRLGGTQQSLVSRGLYNTTAFDNANRGVVNDTNRSLNELAGVIGQMQAGLKTGQAAAEANAYAGLSGSAQSYAALLAQLGLGQANLLGSVQHQGGDGILGPLLGAAGMAGGFGPLFG